MYVLLLLAKLNYHKSALFECIIMLLGKLRRYKRYANAPLCYGVRKMPVVFQNYSLILICFCVS
jgi:hypothetical protein